MKIKKYAALFCLILMIFFCFSIFSQIFIRNVIVERTDAAASTAERVLQEEQGTGSAEKKIHTDIDWEAEYPFNSGNTDPGAETKKQLLTEKIISHIRELIGVYTTDHLPGYNQMIELDSALEKTVGWNIDVLSEYNPLVELEDGYFVSYVMPFDVSPNIEAVAELDAYCRNNGMDFLYVQTPGKISKYEDTEICNVLDFSNKLADDLLLGLEEYGTKTLDLRENVLEAGFRHRDLFFKTDHHWKPETGLWAAGCLAEELNQSLSYHLDTELLRSDGFRKTVYENWFLGSSGKKVTLAKAEPEDISLLYPTYDTDLTIRIPSLSLEKTGDFSVTYDMDCISEKDYMHKNPYGAYCYSDEALIQIINNGNTTGKNICLIKCSYANVVSPFLSLISSRLDIVDLRYFKGSLKAYLNANTPDIVIIMYSPEFIGDVEHITRMNPFDFD